MTLFRRIMLSIFFLVMMLVPFAGASAQRGYYHRRYYRHRPYYRYHHPYYHHRYYHRHYRHY